MQQVCDHVTILARGRCITTGRTSDVLTANTTDDVRLTAPDPMGATNVLANAGYRMSSMGDAWRVHDVHDRAALTKVLADQGHYLSELSPIAADLEDVFLELTERGSEEGAA